MLTPEETATAVARLTRDERAVYAALTVECVCGHQLTRDERNVAARLVRRGLVTSYRVAGCNVRHYRGA